MKRPGQNGISGAELKSVNVDPLHMLQSLNTVYCLSTFHMEIFVPKLGLLPEGTSIIVRELDALNFAGVIAANINAASSIKWNRNSSPSVIFVRKNCNGRLCISFS